MPPSLVQTLSIRCVFCNSYKALIYPFNWWSNLGGRKDVWCHFKALLDQWNDKSTRISAYFQETAGRLFNCWGDNESVSLMESIFHNVAAFCLSDLPFSLGYGKCSKAKMSPVILLEIGLQFLSGAAWLVPGVNSCTTTDPSSGSIRTGLN